MTYALDALTLLLMIGLPLGLVTGCSEYNTRRYLKARRGATRCTLE